MIEKLKSENIEEAAFVYQKTLEEQTPPGQITFENAVSRMRTYDVFVDRENKKIVGLVLFQKKENIIEIRFIGALETGKGIGTKLMNELKNFATVSNCSEIISTVSTQDKRAMTFYDKQGFEKYGIEEIDEDFSVDKIRFKLL